MKLTDSGAHPADRSRARRRGGWRESCRVLVENRWAIAAIVLPVMLATGLWAAGHDSTPGSPAAGALLMSVFLASLAVGIGFAFYREQTRGPIRSVDDVARHLDMPLVGIVPAARVEPAGPTSAMAKTLPSDRNESRLEFISHNQPGSPISAAYRSVRESVLRRTPGDGPRLVLVTSASPGEGKTTTAINLAIAFAEDGTRTVLVSTDFRRPRTDEVFLARATGGLAGVVGGRLDLVDAISDTSVPNLRVLPCGRMPKRPTDLLGSDAFRHLVADLQRDYHCVIFDSPPISKVPEALTLSEIADMTILVVRAGATRRHVAQRALERLGSASVLLNAEVSPSDSRVPIEEPVRRSASRGG